MEDVNTDILRELCDQYGGELHSNQYSSQVTAEFYDGIIEVSIKANSIVLKTSDPSKAFFSSSDIDLTNPRSLRIIGECITFYKVKVKEVLDKITLELHKYGMSKECDKYDDGLTIASAPLDGYSDVVTLVPFVAYKNGELVCNIYVATKSSIFTIGACNPDNIDQFMIDLKDLMIRRSYIS